MAALWKKDLSDVRTLEIADEGLVSVFFFVSNAKIFKKNSFGDNLELQMKIFSFQNLKKIERESIK